jgi:hypothetical protein
MHKLLVKGAKRAGVTPDVYLSTLLTNAALKEIEAAKAAATTKAPTPALRPKHVRSFETAARILDIPTQELVDWLVGRECEQLDSAGVDSLMGELIKAIDYPNDEEREAAFGRLAAFLKRKGAPRNPWPS